MLGRAAAGHGQLVAIVGEPGVGKSRLVWEVMQASRPEGWRIVHVERSLVWPGDAAPTRDRAPPSVLPPRGPRRPAGDSREGEGRLPRSTPRWRRASPRSSPCSTSPAEDGAWQALDPSQRRQRTLDAVKRLWLREAQVQPLLLVVEDLHWIDAETQALLDSLVESLPAARLCLLVDYRPEYQHAWSSKTAYTQLRLDPLSPESAQALLGPSSARPRARAAHGAPHRADRGESVLPGGDRADAGGNQGAGRRARRVRLARPIDTIEVPARSRRSWPPVSTGCRPEARRLLQAAAVIGKDVAVAAPPGHRRRAGAEALRAELAHLQAAEFLYETRLVPDLEYTFKHALTHEVAYRGCTADRRRALHARIVEAIERLDPDRLAEQVERLAHHALRGEVWEKAVGYLHQAGAPGRSAGRVP